MNFHMGWIAYHSAGSKCTMIDVSVTKPGPTRVIK